MKNKIYELDVETFEGLWSRAALFMLVLEWTIVIGVAFGITGLLFVPVIARSVVLKSGLLIGGAWGVSKGFWPWLSRWRVRYCQLTKIEVPDSGGNFERYLVWRGYYFFPEWGHPFVSQRLAGFIKETKVLAKEEWQRLSQAGR